MTTRLAEHNVARSGEDWLVAAAVDRPAFLAEAEPPMAALLALYGERCRDRLPPRVGDLDLAAVFATGMFAETYRLNVRRALDACGFAVWPQIGPSGGQGTPLLRRLRDVGGLGLLAQAMYEALPGVVLFGTAAHLRVVGLIDGTRRLFDVALLPLRTDEGRVAECVVPVRNRLDSLSAERREEIFAQHLRGALPLGHPAPA